jgi:WhiB family redox-sensing transcriptional regulator
MPIDVIVSTRFPIFISDEIPVCATTDPEAFFPEKGLGGQRSVKLAKSMCRSCPYTVKCLQWAIDNKETGIWGGTTEKERRSMAHTRNKNKQTEKTA